MLPCLKVDDLESHINLPCPPDDFVSELSIILPFFKCYHTLIMDDLDLSVILKYLHPQSWFYVITLQYYVSVFYKNIQTLLQDCEDSNSLDLTDMSLRVSRFQPVLQTIQYHSSLQQLELTGMYSSFGLVVNKYTHSFV